MAKLYILGSGFMKELGYPLANEMYDRFSYWCHNISRQTHIQTKPLKYDSEMKKIETLWKRLNINTNINNFMNMIPKNTQVIEELGIEKEAADRYLLIPYIIHDYFWDIIRSCNRESKSIRFKYLLQEFVLKVLKKGDVIINFNYDIEIEKLLNLFAKAWSYNYMPDVISIIKIHGSIDWIKANGEDLFYYEDNQVKEIYKVKDKHAEIFNGVWTMGTEGYYDYLRDKNYWKIQPLPVTIPPMNECVYINNGPYKEIFNYLKSQIANIDMSKICEIYSIGYSYGDDDLDLCNLLKTKFNDSTKWSLVSKDRPINDDIKKLSEGKVKNILALDWLDEYVKAW